VTVAEALETIRRVGAVENHGGKLKLRFPESERAALRPAIETLRSGKAEAIAMLAGPDPAELARASDVLNRAGVRIMRLESAPTIGVWSDFDGPELRAALRALGSGWLPVRYLDGAGILPRYKVRRAEGEPVPMNVLAEMQRHPAEPWNVRDRLLTKMGWCPQGVQWADRKAAAVDRLFQAQRGNRAASPRRPSAMENRRRAAMTVNPSLQTSTRAEVDGVGKVRNCLA
jgi:hypothetical protein